MFTQAQYLFLPVDNALENSSEVLSYCATHEPPAKTKWTADSPRLDAAITSSLILVSIPLRLATAYA